MSELLEVKIVDKNFISTQSVKFNVPHNEGLYIYLTNDCNLSCTHCYMYSGKPKINELEKEEWIRIIKNAKNNGITAITFTGGEVLQYKDWFEVVKFAKENPEIIIATLDQTMRKKIRNKKATIRNKKTIEIV